MTLFALVVVILAFGYWTHTFRRTTTAPVKDRPYQTRLPK